MYRRNPRWILRPTNGSGTLAYEDAFEGSEQSLPFSIAARAVAYNFAKCMNLALREQVAQSFLKLGTSLYFSHRQVSDRDGGLTSFAYLREGFNRTGQTGMRWACCSSSAFNKSLRLGHDPSSETPPRGILDCCPSKCSRAKKSGEIRFFYLLFLWTHNVT